MLENKYSRDFMIKALSSACAFLCTKISFHIVFDAPSSVQNKELPDTRCRWANRTVVFLIKISKSFEFHKSQLFKQIFIYLTNDKENSIRCFLVFIKFGQIVAISTATLSALLPNVTTSAQTRQAPQALAQLCQVWQVHPIHWLRLSVSWNTKSKELSLSWKFLKVLD